MEPIEGIKGGVRTNKPAGEGGTPGVIPVSAQTNRPAGEGGTPGVMAEEDPGTADKSNS